MICSRTQRLVMCNLVTCLGFNCYSGQAIAQFLFKVLVAICFCPMLSIPHVPSRAIKIENDQGQGAG